VRARAGEGAAVHIIETDENRVTTLQRDGPLTGTCA
jgi:hypothetical protein